MKNLIYVLLLTCAKIVGATEVLIAGEHALVTPESLIASDVCFYVEKIETELFIDLYASQMHKSREFSHIWIGGHEQYSVQVTPEKSNNQYKIQVSGSPEQIKKSMLPSLI